MANGIKLLLCVLAAFALCALLSPLVLKLMRRLKAGQTILGYVEKHESKNGTPTMGGIAFLLAALPVSLIFGMGGGRLGIVAAAVTLGYGLIGFLDDFIKVKLRQNMGLKAYQKIIAQLGVAIIVTLFCYKSEYIGTTINLPFSHDTIDLEWWFIPLCIIVFIALTNSVNLTDGLDGLVAKTSSVNFATFAVIIYIASLDAARLGDVLYEKEMMSLAYFCAAMLGAMLAFVWLNANPAKIFMGDTGSLAVGGAITCAAVFSQNPLLILSVGIMYVVSSISVIVQVISFKLTGKRVFLMAPYHHHLEYKGVKESKIVTYYTIITIIAAVITLIGACV